MDIIKIDQLSVAAQAGALDPDLAYAATFTAHRDLVSQTAASGLQGLQALLNDTGYYAEAISRLQEVASNIDDANVLAAKDPFQPASSSLSNQHQVATANGLRNQASPYNSTSNTIQYNAQLAYNNTVSPNLERSYADRLLTAAAELQLSTAYLVNQADPSASINHATNARSFAISVRSDAQTLWNTLNAQSPKPTARLNATQAIINSANDIINHANTVLNFDTTAPIALIRSETPQIHDLGGGYSLATWGDSGFTTLTDSNGAGILIRPDGTTDTLNADGKGWKFSSTSTFVLPNLTKVTFTPGSPASILFDRGVHTFTISGIQSGGYPYASSYTDLNGRDVDLTSNDGYIFQMGGNASSWSNDGNLLGDAGQREVVAQSPITNKLRLDPTDVSLSGDLSNFISRIGITPTDYDSDGKYNNVELGSVATQISNYITQIQSAYEQAMLNVVKANQALEELNEMLDKLRREASTRNDNRTSENAEARTALKSIERKLIAALQLLQGSGAPTPPSLPGGIEASAERVLSQLTQVTQQGGLQNISFTPPGQPTPQQPLQSTSTGTGPVGQDPSPPLTTDTLGDSLRRASRLLSGLLGGTTLNLPPPPDSGAPSSPDLTTPSSPTSGSDAPNTDPISLSLPGLDQLAQTLAAASGDTASASNISLGLQLFLSVLADAGAIDLKNLQSTSDPLTMLASLLGGALPLPVGTGSDTSTGSSSFSITSQASLPPSSQTPLTPLTPSTGLASFISTLSGLGTALGQLPSAGTGSLPGLSTLAQQLRALLAGTSPDTATQVPGPGGTSQSSGALAQLSRVAEQLQLVLAGAASLGSAGAGQGSGTRTPSAADLRLGLQSFITALVAQGLGALGPQSGQGITGSSSSTTTSGISFQGNTQTISAISANFYTDPVLMKQLQENLNKAIIIQNDQLSRASTLFTQSQKIVQNFVTLIKEDDLVRDVVKSDDLSDEQQKLFDDRMTELRKDWGVEWGGDDNRSPASQSQLVSKAMQSGMMV